MSRDKYQYNLQNPIELNRYEYTANNPIIYIDPTGHSSFSDISNYIKYALLNPLKAFYSFGHQVILKSILSECPFISGASQGVLGYFTGLWIYNIPKGRNAFDGFDFEDLLKSFVLGGTMGAINSGLFSLVEMRANSLGYTPMGSDLFLFTGSGFLSFYLDQFIGDVIDMESNVDPIANRWNLAANLAGSYSFVKFLNYLLSRVGFNPLAARKWSVLVSVVLATKANLESREED